MALDHHYFNLHKKVWSVMNGGKVIAHVTCRRISRPVFVVRPAGQRKVRETGRKNVHAFVKGVGTPFDEAEVFAAGWEKDIADGWVEVCYNPYRVDFIDSARRRRLSGNTAPFYVKDTGAPVYEAQEAILTADRRLFVYF